MKPILLLALLSCAEAKPTQEQPMNLAYGPFRESLYYPSGNLRETHTFKLTSDGRYWMHTITIGGKASVRVFPVVPERIKP